MSAYSDKVIADGATLYMRLDEASGNAVSLVGGYTGTVSGGVTRNQSGALSDGNAAMQFDGTSGNIAVPIGTYSAFGTGPFTIEWWLRKTIIPPSGRYILDNLAPGFRVLYDQDQALYIFLHDGTNQDLWATINAFDSAWHHYVFSFTRGGPDTGRLYIDGVAVVQQAATGNGRSYTSPNTLNMMLGAAPVVAMSGFLDEVAIYPTALTPQQIAAHYTIGTMPAWHDLRFRYCRFVRHPRWRQHAS